MKALTSIPGDHHQLINPVLGWTPQTLRFVSVSVLNTKESDYACTESMSIWYLNYYSIFPLFHVTALYHLYFTLHYD